MELERPTPHRLQFSVELNVKNIIYTTILAKTHMVNEC